MLNILKSGEFLIILACAIELGLIVDDYVMGHYASVAADFAVTLLTYGWVQHYVYHHPT